MHYIKNNAVLAVWFSTGILPIRSSTFVPYLVYGVSLPCSEQLQKGTFFVVIFQNLVVNSFKRGRVFFFFVITVFIKVGRGFGRKLRAKTKKNVCFWISRRERFESRVEKSGHSSKQWCSANPCFSDASYKLLEFVWRITFTAVTQTLDG